MQTVVIYETNLKREAGYNLWMDEVIERRRDKAVPFGQRGAFDKAIARDARRLAAANGGTIRDYMRLLGNTRLRGKNVVDLPAQNRYDEVTYPNM